MTSLTQKCKNSSEFTTATNNMRPCTDRRRRSGAQTSGTDVKRSRTGRRSVRVPRRIPRKGGVRASITPNIRVLCYPLSPRYLQAFPTSYSFPLPCVRVEKHEHFFVPHFFNLFLKDLYKYLCKM